MVFEVSFGASLLLAGLVIALIVRRCMYSIERIGWSNKRMMWKYVNGAPSRVSFISLLSLYISHLYLVTMPPKAQSRKAEEPFDGLSKWIESKHTGYKCRLVSKEIPGIFTDMSHGWC